MRGGDDDALLAELGEATRGEVTEQARAAARGAFAWRTIDEDLMHLTHDSWSPASGKGEPALVRGVGTATRVVGFHGGAFTLEVEFDDDVVMGQVVPARECQVTVLTPEGEAATVDTDASGIFSIPAPGSTLVRFAVTIGDERQVTQWLPV